MAVQNHTIISHSKFLMELLSFNNKFLAIKILSSDGKSCEFIIFLKAKAFYNYSAKFVLHLPSNEENQDPFKTGSFFITEDFSSNLQKLMIHHFKDLYAKRWDLRKSLVVVPTLREFVEQEKFLIFEENFNEEIHEEKNDNEGEKILDNSRVMKMMTNMGYELGKGLGRQSEGAPAFVIDDEIRPQKHTYGIGYRSTTLDDIKQKQIRIEKARAKKEDVPFELPMRPYPLTLNGQFTRAGDIFPFWGFRDPVIVATGWDI